MMYRGIDKGVFQNTALKQLDNGRSYWLIENEQGESYYDVRDNLRPKYIVITEVEPPYLVAGACEEGYFGFGSPYRVYFLETVPDDVLMVRYCYDGKAFTPLIDVEQWRYNEMNWLKNTIDEREDNGLDASHLRQYRVAVRQYTGDGIKIPFPVRP